MGRERKPIAGVTNRHDRIYTDESTQLSLISLPGLSHGELLRIRTMSLNRVTAVAGPGAQCETRAPSGQRCGRESITRWCRSTLRYQVTKASRRLWGRRESAITGCLWCKGVQISALSPHRASRAHTENATPNRHAPQARFRLQTNSNQARSLCGSGVSGFRVRDRELLTPLPSSELLEEALGTGDGVRGCRHDGGVCRCGCCTASLTAASNSCPLNGFLNNR